MRYNEWQQAVMRDLKQLNERVAELEEELETNEEDSDDYN